MACEIPEAYKDLFEKRAFAYLATLVANARPQVTPVWCDFDGSHIRINSSKGRVKDRNMRRNKNVALTIVDPDDPYRHVDVQGEVVEITEDGADDHLKSLTRKYLGTDQNASRRPGETRVIYRIRPDRVTQRPGLHG
jgi:PPOX class probable F420-dependent enzyme